MGSPSPAGTDNAINSIIPPNESPSIFAFSIKAIIAESYERIHRSNLVGMGVLPLQYKTGDTAESLGLTGNETFTITGIAEDIKPLKRVQVIAKKEDGSEIKFQAIARMDSKIEIEYYRNGGILQYVLRQFLKKTNKKNNLFSYIK